MNKLFVMVLMLVVLSVNVEDKVWILMGVDVVGSLNFVLSEFLLFYLFVSGFQVWIGEVVIDEFVEFLYMMYE